MIPNQENKKPASFVKSIKKVQNNYVVVFCDDNNLEEVYKFTEDQMVEYRITLNKWFTKSDLETIIKSTNLSIWYSKALKYIFIKPRTEKEIWSYLDKSNLDLDSIQTIINKLLEYKYLDDERYLLNFLEQSFEKCLGKTYVIYELEKLGISSELINLHIDNYNEEEMIEQLTIKYQKIQYTLTNLPIVKQKLKLTQKMALKGLSTTTIHEILKNLEYDEDIDDAFEKDLNKIKTKTNNENKIIHKLLMLGYTYDYIKRHIDV